MKTKIITLIALLIAGGLNMYAQDKKILVAYFSWSGNTQYVAEQIAKQTGGTLFRIEPVKPYPTEYTPCTEVKKRKTTPAPLSRTRWKIGTVTTRCSSAAPYGGGPPR